MAKQAGKSDIRVGLVLGAGGVVGASWLIGAVEALNAETGWNPREAEHIVGTSAGSVIGSLCAAGIDPELMATIARDQSGEMAEVEEMAEAADRSVGTEYRFAFDLPPIGPGSWRMAVSTLLHPTRHAPAAMLSGWLPRGFIRTEPIRRLVERHVTQQWPEHPNLWVVACDYTDGRRVAFGRDDAPPARIGEAVAASCAIPAFYHPVKVAGRRYVDGGVCSMSNLDLLAGRGLDLVICLNPMSSRAEPRANGPAQRLAALVRAGSGRRLGHEARKLREEGTRVVLIQPTAEDLEVMGLNFMARNRRTEVMEQARASVGAQLRALRDEGELLPGSARGRSKTAARSRRLAA